MRNPTILVAAITLCFLPSLRATEILTASRQSSAFSPAELQPTTPAPAIVSRYNLLQELAAWSDLTVLLRLAGLFPDLVEAAISSDPLLVFAPTNEAFLTVAKVFLPDTPDDADPDAILAALTRIFEALANAAPQLPGVKDILTYHIVAGDLAEHEIVAAKRLKTLFGRRVGTRSYPRKIRDKDPTVSSKRLGRQIKTTNGRISFVDNVLIPFNVTEELFKANVTLPLSVRMGETGDLDKVFKPFRSLVDFVTSRNDLTVLATLAAGSELLLDVLSSSFSLHVFAPTDRAFVDLAAALVPEGSDIGLLPEGELTVPVATAFAKRLADTWAVLEDVPSLEQIVAYHVLNTTESYEDLVGEGPRETLFGGDARIEVKKRGVRDDDKDRGDAPLVASFTTGNGFVSVINGVLLPFPASEAVEAVKKALMDGAIPTEEPEPDVTPDGDDDAVCFPAHATVRLEDGSHKRMDELSAGDRVAVSNDEHSAVYLFTHRLQERTATFVTIETDCDRSVTLTPSHYVYVDGKLTSAGVVQVGEKMETVAGLCRVVKLSTGVRRGLFAPHTMQGDLLVDGVRVSSYSTAVEPRLAHRALAVVRAFVKMGMQEPLKGWFDSGAPRLAAMLPKGYDRY